MGLSVRCQALSFDVDTIADLRRLSEFLESTDDPLPRTREALREVLPG